MQAGASPLLVDCTWMFKESIDFQAILIGNAGVLYVTEGLAPTGNELRVLPLKGK